MEEKGGKKQQGRLVVKTAKGTRDFGPAETVIRERVLEVVRRVFRKHGAEAIETPVFERREILMGRYGEDEKLVYELADQGGEQCCLRYDLTVPFSRYVAQNNVRSMKKYQVGKVYRRDQPNIAKGRYREFYQCDFDIAGEEYSAMLPDAECLVILSEVLSKLEVGAFAIKLNDRRLLDGIFSVCGVPAANFAPICSAVDKLDKMTWEQVKSEMTQEKGLDEAVADRLGQYVQLNGAPRELLKRLAEEEELKSNESAAAALEELSLLFDYLEMFDVLDNISFDLSLARGLSYYTGIIFEAVLTDTKLRVGSVGGGGRYDNLVGQFKKKKKRVPCVGFSVGVERLFTVLEKKRGKAKAATSFTKVMVASPERDFLPQKAKLVKELWDAGIPAEILLKQRTKIQSELNYAANNSVPLALIIGSSEVESGVVGLKDLRSGVQKSVARAQVVKEVREALQAQEEAQEAGAAEDGAEEDAKGNSNNEK